MGKVANLKDIKRGGSMSFNYKGNKAILVRTKEDKLVAYIALCPHAGGDIEWDEGIHKLLCETHMSLFNPENGSLYKHSKAVDLDEGLTRVDLKVDEGQDIYALSPH